MQYRDKGLSRGAFTLVELIVVIAILSIISTLAVSRIGALREKAARKVSVANQQAVGRAVETFLAINDGKLNRLDSLIDAGTGNSGATGYDFSEHGGVGSVGGLYRGPDDQTTETVRERNSGIHDDLLAALCTYRVNAHEANALRRIGLAYVMRHLSMESATDVGIVTGGDGEKLIKGDDGALAPVSGRFDSELSACVAKSVTNGMVFAAVNPMVNRGRDIFRACGSDLERTSDADSGYSEATVKAEVAATGGPLLAFGLGDSASIIGASQGGLDSAPYSEVVPAKYYRRYIVLFRLRMAATGSAQGVTVEFAGVLDPQGNTIPAARQALKE